MHTESIKNVRESWFKRAFMLLFLLIGICVHATEPCPIRPGVLLSASRHRMYVFAEHPWMGTDAGAVISVHRGMGTTNWFSYPSLQEDSGSSVFRPLSAAVDFKGNCLYVGYQDGIVVMPPPESVKAPAGNTTGSDWVTDLGMVKGLTLLEKEGILRVVHARFERAELIPGATHVRLTGEISRRVTDIPLDSRGRMLIEAAQEVWKTNVAISETFPNQPEHELKEQALVNWGIRASCNGNKNQTWFVMEDDICKLNVKTGKLHRVPLENVENVVDMAHQDDGLVVLVNTSTSSELIFVTDSELDEEVPLPETQVVPIPNARGICAAEDLLYVSSTSENKVYVLGRESGADLLEIVDEFYLCDTVWQPDPETLRIRILTPPDGTWAAEETALVTGQVNREQAVVAVTGGDIVRSGNFFLSNVDLYSGENRIMVTATDEMQTAEMEISVFRENVLSMVVESPANGTETSQEFTTVSGTVSVADCRVMVNGQPATVSGNNFSCSQVPLEPGQNVLWVCANSVWQDTCQNVVITRVTDTGPLDIDILQPESGTGTAEQLLTVTGTVSHSDAIVTINNAQAHVDAQTFSGTVTLQDGENLIRVEASRDAVVVSDTIMVILDRTPPDVFFANVMDQEWFHESRLSLNGQLVDNTDPNPVLSINGDTVSTSSGQFQFTGLQLNEGSNEILWEAEDRFSNRQQGVLHLNLDTEMPRVEFTGPDWLFRGSTAQISVDVTDNSDLINLTIWLNGSEYVNGNDSHAEVEIQVEPDEPQDHVELRAVARDRAGNRTERTLTVPVYDRAYCYINVLDDTTGHPITEIIEAYNVQSADFSKNAAIKNERTGRIGVFSDSVGGALLSISASDYTEVRRIVGLLVEDNRLLDARLTPVNPETVSVSPDSGGVITLDDMNMSIPSGAVASETAVRLTGISPQGLIYPLPAGWSPVRVFDLQFNDSYEHVLSSPADVTVEHVTLLEPDDCICLVVFDWDLNEWRVAGQSVLHANTLQSEVSGSGQYAWVVRDRNIDQTNPVTGARIIGTVDGHWPSASVASSWTDPAAIAVSVDIRATAHLQLENTDHKTPSGLPVRVRSSEWFDYIGSGIQHSREMNQDFILYAWPGNADLRPILCASFPVVPTAETSPETVSEGLVTLTFFPRISTGTGRVISPDYSWTVGTANGIQVNVPTGGVSGPGYLELRESPVALPVALEIEMDDPFEIILEETEFTMAPVVSTAWSPNISSQGTFLLCRVSESMSGKLEPVCRAEFVTDGQTGIVRLTTVDNLNDSGVDRSGSYVFVHVPYMVGEAYGTALLDGSPLSGTVISIEDSIFATISNTEGNYQLIAETGVQIRLNARHMETNAQGVADITIPSDGNIQQDIELAVEGLYLIQLTPEPGLLSSRLPIFDLMFNSPLDAGQNLDSLISLSGFALAIGVNGQTITVRVLNELPEGGTVTLTVTGGKSGILDRFGGSLAQDLQFEYRLPMGSSRAFDVGDIILEEMARDSSGAGRLRISAATGVLSEGTVVEVENESTLAWFSDTISENEPLDHEFDGYPGDRIRVNITLPDASIRSFVITRCRLISGSGDPARFYVDTQGGTITGDGGIQLAIPSGALDRAVELDLSQNDDSTHNTIQQQFPLSSDETATCLTSFRIQANRSVELRLPMTLRVPVTDDGTGDAYRLVDFRENVILPAVDPATGMPVYNSTTGEMLISHRDIRLVRGDAYHMTNNASTSSSPNMKAKIPDTYLMAQIDSLRAGDCFDGMTEFDTGISFIGGIDRLSVAREITGALHDLDDTPVSAFILVDDASGVGNTMVPASFGSFCFVHPGELDPAAILGMNMAKQLSGIGIKTTDDTSSTKRKVLTVSAFWVWLEPWPPAPVSSTDVSAPEFTTRWEALDSDGTVAPEIQQAFESTGIVPDGALLKVHIENIVDDQDPSPLVSVYCNGESISVSRSERGFVAVISSDDGPASTTKSVYKAGGTGVTVEISVSDATGNTARIWRDTWFGITGSESIQGCPKLIPGSCRPGDGDTSVPVTVEFDLLFNEPVTVAEMNGAVAVCEDHNGTLVPVEMGLDVLPLMAEDGYAASYHVKLAQALLFDQDYAVCISGVHDLDGELLDQDAVSGLLNGLDGLPGTPAVIHFRTTSPVEGELGADGGTIADICFLDQLAFCAVVTSIGNTRDDDSSLQLFDLTEPGEMDKPLLRLELNGQPRALAVRHFSRTRGNGSSRNGYLVAVMRKASGDYNSIISLYEVFRAGISWESELVGVTTHCLSRSRSRGDVPSYSLEFKGDRLFAGVANGSILTDTVSGQEYCPGTGIRIYSVEAMRQAYQDSEMTPLHWTIIDHGSGIAYGLIDFAKTPGFCWDLDMVNITGEETALWAVVGDGSRFQEVLGIDLTAPGTLPEDVAANTLDIIDIDPRVLLRQQLSGKAPYMVEVREGFSFVDYETGTPVPKTIHLGVLRANDMGTGPNRLYLLDVSHPESGAYKILSVQEFENDDRIGYVFLDPVRSIMGATFAGYTTRFYDVSDPVHPTLFYTAGLDGNPGFLARGSYDGIAFGSRSDGPATLDFNPDPFDYFGFRGVLASQYEELVERETVLPDITPIVFMRNDNSVPIPIDRELELEYSLFEKGKTTLSVQQIDGNGNPLGGSRVLFSDCQVMPNVPVTYSFTFSELMGGLNQLNGAFAGKLTDQVRTYRYTLDAVTENQELRYQKTGEITLKPMVAVKKPGHVIAGEIHTGTGELVTTRTDLALPAPELPLVITRTYCNRGHEGNGPSGPGWELSPFMSLARVDEDHLVLNTADFSAITFTRNDAIYEPDPGYFGHIEGENGIYTYVNRDGIRYRFQRLEMIHVGDTSDTGMSWFIDPYNGRVTNAVPNLKEIEGHGGQKITFNYDPDTGCLVSIKDTTGRTVYLEYQSRGGARRVSALKLDTGAVFTRRYNYQSGTGDLLNSIVSGKPIMP